jgi:DNA-binding CsgD family transcriptional regulator
MLIKNNNNFTYSGYLQKIYYANDIIDKEHIQQMLLRFKQLSFLSVKLPNSPVFFAIDYSKRQYIFFSNSLGDYQTEQIIEGGLDFMIPLMHKDFFNMYNEKVFSATLSFLKDIPQSEHADYIISCNHKAKNINNEDIDFYQRYTYITSEETGLPTHCVGMAVDISHFKSDNRITLSFEKTNKQTGFTSLIDKKYFFPHQEDSPFTKQEKIILQYMTDGLNSKMIADKLHLSHKTINNHRENMLRKANANNVVQLVSFAFRNNII